MTRFLVGWAAIGLMMVTSGRPAAADRPVEGTRHLAGRRHRPPYAPHYRELHGYYLRPMHRVAPYRWPYPYPCPPYYYGRYYPAPLYVPAGELYGPQATARFLGWNNFDRRGPIVNPIVPGGNDQPQPRVFENEGAEANRNLRGTNEKALSLAWKFIGYGDAHFAKEKYSDAYQRYRKAVQAAPQLAAGYLRQGYALAAVGRYELASKALKHGLALDSGWPASGFRNDELFGRNQLAKTANLDAMAKAADAQPHNADLMFLLGVYFHFEGDPERAGIFFRRAGELVGGDDAHLKAFMGR